MQTPARLGIRHRETGYLPVTPWIGGPWRGSRRRLPHQRPTLPRARASPTREHLRLPTRSRPRRSRRRSARRKPARPQPPMKRPRVSLDPWSRPSSPPPTTPFAFATHTLKTLGSRRKLFPKPLFGCPYRVIDVSTSHPSTVEEMFHVGCEESGFFMATLGFRTSIQDVVGRRVGL